MTRIHRLIILSALLAVGGCGDDGENRAADTRPAPTPAATKTPEDVLVDVNDALVSCLQQVDDAGITVQFRDGKAVTNTGEGGGGGEYDDRISSPEIIGDLVESGQAQFVGLRAGSGPDIDMVILASAEEAAAVQEQLAEEHPESRFADQQGVIVTLPLDPKGKEIPDAPVRNCIDAAALEAI